MVLLWFCDHCATMFVSVCAGILTFFLVISWSTKEIRAYAFTAVSCLRVPHFAVGIAGCSGSSAIIQSVQRCHSALRCFFVFKPLMEKGPLRFLWFEFFQLFQ